MEIMGFIFFSVVLSLSDLVILKKLPLSWLENEEEQQGSQITILKEYRFKPYFYFLLLINCAIAFKIPIFLPLTHKALKFAYLNILILIALIDAYYYIIPNQFTLILALLGFAQGLIIEKQKWLFLLASALGIFLVLFLLTLLLNNLLKKETFGMGDIKLLAAIALARGLTETMSLLNRAAIAALVYFIFRLVIRKKVLSDPIPFGPFIIASLFMKFFLG